MAITTTNINTGGAVVTYGGTVKTADSDGYVIGTTGGTDVGCTTGGVTVNYTFETSDIFCDQILSPVDVAITGETATVEFEMLETHVTNLKTALSQYVSASSGSNEKIGVGGVRTLVMKPIMLKIPDSSDGANETTWTFFKVKPGGFSTAFNRDNPSTVKVTFTAFADTSKTSGHQLFSINYGPIAA